MKDHKTYRPDELIPPGSSGGIELTGWFVRAYRKRPGEPDKHRWFFGPGASQRGWDWCLG